MTYYYVLCHRICQKPPRNCTWLVMGLADIPDVLLRSLSYAYGFGVRTVTGHVLKGLNLYIFPFLVTFYEKTRILPIYCDIVYYLFIASLYGDDGLILYVSLTLPWRSTLLNLYISFFSSLRFFPIFTYLASFVLFGTLLDR